MLFKTLSLALLLLAAIVPNTSKAQSYCTSGCTVGIQAGGTNTVKRLQFRSNGGSFTWVSQVSPFSCGVFGPVADFGARILVSGGGTIYTYGSTNRYGYGSGYFAPNVPAGIHTLEVSGTGCPNLRASYQITIMGP